MRINKQLLAQLGVASNRGIQSFQPCQPCVIERGGIYYHIYRGPAVQHSGPRDFDLPIEGDDLEARLPPSSMICLARRP